MNLLHVSDYFNPNTGHFINNATARLVKRGHNVRIYTSSALFDDADYGGESKGRVERFKGGIVGNKNIYPGLITRMLSQANPDVVHSYVLGFWASFVSGYLKKIKNYPLVIEADFDAAQPIPPLWKEPYIYLYRKIPGRIADIVTVFTEAQKKALSNRFGIREEKVRVLPIGIDSGEFLEKKGGKGKELGLKGKFVVLNVSKIWDVKRIEMVLEAIAGLKRERIHFLQAGEVLQKDYWGFLQRKVKELGLKGKVTFLGNVRHEELIEYYHCADVYVQASLSESFCIPVLEAMASSLPVVSTRTGMAAETVENGRNGFLVGNKKEMAESIGFLMESPGKRKQMGRENRRVSEGFDWEKIVSELEGIYEEVIKR